MEIMKIFINFSVSLEKSRIPLYIYIYKAVIITKVGMFSDIPYTKRITIINIVKKIIIFIELYNQIMISCFGGIFSCLKP